MLLTYANGQIGVESNKHTIADIEHRSWPAVAAPTYRTIVCCFEKRTNPTFRPFPFVISNAQNSRPRLYQWRRSSISRAIILACSRASLSPARTSPSGSGIALRPRTTMLKKYRGIQKECAKNQKVAVRKRTDFAMLARFLTLDSVSHAKVQYHHHRQQSRSRASPLRPIWSMACSPSGPPQLGRYAMPSIASTVRSNANTSTTDAPRAASSSFVAT